MLSVLLLLLFMESGHITESPVNWTLNAKQYESFIESPVAQDCRYWGAAQMEKHCVGYMVFNSNPKHLKCSTDSKYSNIIRCSWDLPEARK